MATSITHYRDVGYISELNVIDDFIHLFQKDPDLELVVFPDADVTFTCRDVFEAAKSVSVSLKEIGISVGDTISLCTDTTPNAFIMMFGIWLSGATANPVNIDVGLDELALMIEIVEPKLIYSSELAYEHVKGAVKTSSTKIDILSPLNPDPHLDFEKWKICDNSSFQVPILDAEKHIMSILFTSGTTGVPKGIKLRGKALKLMSLRCDLSVQGSKLLSPSPISWLSYSIFSIIAVLKGMTLILHKSGTPIINIFKAIAKYKPDQFFACPAVYFDMSTFPKRKDYDISSLMSAVSGGSWISANSKCLINETVFDNRIYLKSMYGCTEAGILTYWGDNMQPSDPEYESVGRPENGVIFKIIDPINGTSLEPGVEGEICVKCDTLMEGIVKTKFEDIQEIDKEGWFHTGDIGYYDKNKFIYFVSRLKDIMKYRGNQIAPSELERILLKHSEVFECCVIGKPHLGVGDLPTACVVKKKDSLVSELELCSFVAERVPDYKKLRGGVYFIDSIPKTPTGKVSRKNLEKLILG